MRAFGRESWGTGGHFAGLIVEVEADSHKRAGASQTMPPVGTRCLCVRHGGDCFWYYQPIAADGALGERFGAYVFGKPVGRAVLRVESVEPLDVLPERVVPHLEAALQSTPLAELAAAFKEPS